MNKLFCDLKTDEEKYNFFLSGQGYATGVIAKAIQNDVAMAYHRADGLYKYLLVADKRIAELEEALKLMIERFDQPDNIFSERLVITNAKKALDNPKN